MIRESQQIDKFKSIRKDPIQKIGLRLSVKKMRELAARQILATKGVPEIPVSSFSQEEYVMNENVTKPLKTKINPNMTPIIVKTGVREEKDFTRYTRNNVGNKAPTSTKVFIQPVSSMDKIGPKWGGKV